MVQTCGGHARQVRRGTTGFSRWYTLPLWHRPKMLGAIRVSSAREFWGATRGAAEMVDRMVMRVDEDGFGGEAVRRG